MSGKSNQRNDYSGSREKVTLLWRTDQLARLGAGADKYTQRGFEESEYSHTAYTSGFAEFEANRKRIANGGSLLKAAARRIAKWTRKMKFIKCLKYLMLLTSDVMLLVANVWLFIILAALFGKWGQS